MQKKPVITGLAAALAAAVFMAGPAAAAEPGDFIDRWLVLGTFPNPSGPDRQGEAEGFKKDYLEEHGGEAGISRTSSYGVA